MDDDTSSMEEEEVATDLDAEQKQDTSINCLIADNQDNSSTVDLSIELNADEFTVVDGPVDALAERMQQLSLESRASVEAFLLESKLKGKKLAPGATASKYQKETVTVEQMKCLRVDTCLSTFVIDFYLTLLQAYLQRFEAQSISTPSIVIYRLDFIALLTSTPNRVIDVERVVRGYTNLNIFIGVSKLFIPCNPTDHWVWIEVLMDEHVLLYHDSLRTVNDDDFRFFTTTVLDYLRQSATLWGVPLNR
jgi:hypothetical protein